MNRWPQELIPPLQREELELARGPGIPDMVPFLEAFLACTISTIIAVVVAVAHALDHLESTEAEFRRALDRRNQSAVAEATFSQQLRHRLETLHEARDTLHALLKLTTAWLVSGVIGIGLLHRWPWIALPEHIAAILRPLGTASTIFSGAYYSCLLCVLFLPAELQVRRAAGEIALLQGGAKRSRSAVRAWLEEEGFELSTTAELKNLSVVFAPLLASVLQGLATL